MGAPYQVKSIIGKSLRKNCRVSIVAMPKNKPYQCVLSDYSTQMNNIFAEMTNSILRDAEMFGTNLPDHKVYISVKSIDEKEHNQKYFIDDWFIEDMA